MLAVPHRATEWGWFILAVIGVAWATVELCRRRSLGRVLLDCGGHGQREMQLGFGVLLGALGLFALLFVPSDRFRGFYWMVDACLLLVSSTRRFQIREAGVYGPKCFRWEQIEEYYLSPKGGLGLKLRGSDWIWSGRVPADLWREANELLASQLPAQPGVIVAA